MSPAIIIKSSYYYELLIYNYSNVVNTKFVANNVVIV